MKRLIFCFTLCLSSLQAADIAAMVKQHSDHSKFSDRPYGKSDLSYGGFFEFFDGPAGWRLGAMYGSGLSGKGEADSVITPEITLLLQDGLWETGISALIDYIDEDGNTGWSDHYYQFQLGLNLPFGKNLSVGAHAFYALDKIQNITDFRFNNLDYGLTLRLKF